MQNNQQNEPYKDFEEMFKEEKQEKQEQLDKKQFRQKMLSKHIIALSSYIVGFLFLASLITLLISLIPGSINKVSPVDQVIESVISDSDGIAFVEKEAFNNSNSVYKKYLYTLDYDENLLIVVNNYNLDTFKKDWVIIDEDKSEHINLDTLSEFIDGTRTTWEGNRKIVLYRTDEGQMGYPSFIVNYDLVNDVVINKDTQRYSNMTITVTNVLINVILIGVVGYLLWPNIKIDFEPFKKKDLQMILGIFVGFGILFGAMAVSDVIQQLITIIFNISGGQSQNQLAIEMSLSGFGIPLMIFVTVILAPIIEELIFRKTIFELSRKPRLGIIISSFAFGLLHVSSELATLTSIGHFLYVLTPYLAMGFAFGGVYMIFKENVIVTIGAHMIWNALSIIIALVAF